MVGHGQGNAASCQLEVRHPAASQLQQDPHIRAARRDTIAASSRPEGEIVRRGTERGYRGLRT